MEVKQTDTPIVEEAVKKRGRKPKSLSSKIYFGPVEEEAVNNYIILNQKAKEKEDEGIEEYIELCDRGILTLGPILQDYVELKKKMDIVGVSVIYEYNSTVKKSNNNLSDIINEYDELVKKGEGRRTPNVKEYMRLSRLVKDKKSSVVAEYIKKFNNEKLPKILMQSNVEQELLTIKIQRDKLYTTILEPAFGKLVESIIRTYGLYVPDESFEETYWDALCDISTKIDKYKINSGTKAYSYYGTCIKHYVRNRRIEYYNNIENHPSYDTITEETNLKNQIVNRYERDKHIAQDELEKVSERIKHLIDNSKEYMLKKNEIKVGEALLNLFENWDSIISKDGSNKLNKSAVLLFLKENTGFDSKTIRNNMKKYKKEFLEVKESVLNDD